MSISGIGGSLTKGVRSLQRPIHETRNAPAKAIEFRRAGEWVPQPPQARKGPNVKLGDLAKTVNDKGLFLWQDFLDECLAQKGKRDATSYGANTYANGGGRRIFSRHRAGASIP
jgi:hypothetical protein